VNTAKRIQGNPPPGQILISQSVFDEIGEWLEVEGVEDIQAKGKREPVPVYQELGFKAR